MARRSYQSLATGKSRPIQSTGEDTGLVADFRRLLLDEVDLHELSRLDSNQRRARLERVIAHLVSREGIILSTSERNRLIRRVVDEAVGLGVLEPILAELPGEGPVLLFVNGMGGTPLLELYLMYGEVKALLDEAGRLVFSCLTRAVFSRR